MIDRFRFFLTAKTTYSRTLVRLPTSWASQGAAIYQVSNTGSVTFALQDTQCAWCRQKDDRRNLLMAPADRWGARRAGAGRYSQYVRVFRNFEASEKRHHNQSKPPCYCEAKLQAIVPHQKQASLSSHPIGSRTQVRAHHQTHMAGSKEESGPPKKGKLGKSGSRIISWMKLGFFQFLRVFLPRC